MEPPVPSRRRLLASSLRNPSKKTRHRHRKVPRSKHMGKSILEQLSEPKESTSRSDSSPLARVSLVRSPGSEDLSDSTTSSRGEPPARAATPMPEASLKRRRKNLKTKIIVFYQGVHRTVLFSQKATRRSYLRTFEIGRNGSSISSCPHSLTALLFSLRMIGSRTLNFD
jgi:hypothetical protein